MIGYHINNINFDMVNRVINAFNPNTAFNHKLLWRTFKSEIEFHKLYYTKFQNICLLIWNAPVLYFALFDIVFWHVIVLMDKQ